MSPQTRKKPKKPKKYKKYKKYKKLLTRNKNAQEINYIKQQTNLRQIDNLDKSPVIGILSIPLTASKHKNTHSYLPSSYVKWIEMNGGRVVPIQYDLPSSVLGYLLSQCNGVLFIGGQVDHNIISREYYDFMHAVKYIFNYIKGQNIKGNYYPIFSICLGFEVLAMIEDDPDINNLEKIYNKHIGISNVKARNYGSTNIFTNVKKSNLASIFTKKEKEYQAKNRVTYQNHGLGFLLHKPYMKKYLKHWQIVAVAPENAKKPRKFVNMLEYRKYPFYGTQFHPEKVFYEWIVPEVLHSPGAREVSNKLSRFFIHECKKNKNMLLSRRLLIYNYTLYSRKKIVKVLRPDKQLYTRNKSSFETSYYFNIDRRGI